MYICIFIYVYISQFQLNDPSMVSFFLWILKKKYFFLFPKNLNTIEIWLILPVVICLFQGLSHACLRITAMQESAHGSLHQTQSAAKMLRKRIIGYLVRNAKLIHELMGSSRSTRRRFRPKAWWPTLRMNESTNQCTSRCSNTE